MSTSREKLMRMQLQFNIILKSATAVFSQGVMQARLGHPISLNC